MPLGITALDALADACEQLGRVLGGRDATAIEKASAHLAEAAASVRAIGAWRSDPAVAQRLADLRPMLEAARIRTTLLADFTAQRLSMMAMQGNPVASLTYGRPIL